MSRICKGCSVDISHKHPNAKFHNSSCKDGYWNRVNPRGLGLTLNAMIAEDQEHNLDADGSWDARQCHTVDDEARHKRIHDLRRIMRN